jgi:hypothetical protein
MHPMASSKAEESPKRFPLDISIHDVLHQIAADVKQHAPHLRMTIDPCNGPEVTWTAVLTAAANALQPSDEQTTIYPERTKASIEAKKKFVAELGPIDPTPGMPLGLAIQSRFPADGEWPEPTPTARENLRKLAKESVGLPPRQPFFQTTARLMDAVLPIISGSLRLSGLEADPDGPQGPITAELKDKSMLWDTGAHQCLVTSDLLPAHFREYLNTIEHDSYRDESGTRVQVDGVLALSNLSFTFTTIFLVVPTSAVPNNESIIILGQRAFLNRLVCTATPRTILVRRGEDVDENTWGVINLLEWIDNEDKVTEL